MDDVELLPRFWWTELRNTLADAAEDVVGNFSPQFDCSKAQRLWAGNMRPRAYLYGREQSVCMELNSLF
jgi:hypothetical protein